jgi:DNA-binding transcriptional ArsR family regulator
MMQVMVNEVLLLGGLSFGIVLGVAEGSLGPIVSAMPAAAMIPIASRLLISLSDDLDGSTSSTMPVVEHTYFVYHQTMNVADHDGSAVARIAAAIGEPARARILYCLMDGHARTSTELAMVAEVSPSTASVHLNRLKTERLVDVVVQGKHRYYSLEGSNVASALEGLSVLAGRPRDKFVPRTPDRLLAARTCYDHMAGAMGVRLHDRFKALGWLSTGPKRDNGDNAYDLTLEGTKAVAALGIDVEQTRGLRRRFACACLDWSERRPHVGGALGAALLQVVLKKKWVVQELDSRALRVTSMGRREMLARFGLHV